MKKSRLFRLPAIMATYALMAFMASCAEENMGMEGTQAGDGDEVAVQFSYTVSSISPATRTIPADMENGGANADGANIKVLNMWILQFDGKEANSRLLGAPRFVSEDVINASGNQFMLPLVQNSSVCYTVFVANIAAGAQFEWNLATGSTFADVIKKVKTLQEENASWETFHSSNASLLMSAVTEDAVVPGTTLEPEFKRNVAKVTLNLKLANSDMEILSVRLRNVSNTIVYADAALAKLGVPSVYPADVVVMDYPAVTTGLPASGSPAVPFSWYVPRNQRGTSIAPAAKDKTLYAPQGATYFEIVAKHTATSATSVFRVYPGADEVMDYNIVPNTHYTVGLTVVGIDNSYGADSRVETFADVDYTVIGATSNSFILNPAPAGGGDRVYRIPVSQVNRYWGNAYEGYGNDLTKIIGDNDPWVVSLIWSDHSNLFGNNGGITLRGNNSGYGLGEGKGPDQWFELNVPAGLAAGNFTLGIKKTTGTGTGQYLWSWHFWVTDYNPGRFNSSVIANGVYTYPVPGGQVERYSGTAGNLWETAYANKVMMDRNLGAVENFFTTQPDNALRGNLHYQFGRKDPFPTCGVTGTAITSNPGTVPVKTTISTPNVFYTATDNWASDATDIGYQWNDPQANTAAKSIYDPCPPGWRMPANGIWNDFNRNTSADGVTTYWNTQNTSRDLAWSYGRGIGTAVTPVNGLRYWPGTTVTAPVGGRIWYPAAGYRRSSSGSLGGVGSDGYYWSDAAYAVEGSRGLGFYSGGVNPSNGNNRAYGFSVRCVAE